MAEMTGIYCSLWRIQYHFAKSNCKEKKKKKNPKYFGFGSIYICTTVCRYMVDIVCRLTVPTMSICRIKCKRLLLLLFFFLLSSRFGLAAPILNKLTVYIFHAGKSQKSNRPIGIIDALASRAKINRECVTRGKSWIERERERERQKKKTKVDV